MSRRGNQEGNIRQRTDSGWEASVTINGHRYYVRGKTRTEAQRALAELKREHALGELVPRSRVTVAEHLAEWLEAVSADLKPKTVREYEICVRVWLNPAFGSLKLQTLTGAHIDRQFGRWKSEGTVKGGTLLNVFRVLHRALTFAVRWRRIGRNPCDGLEAPKAIRNTPGLWNAQDGERFLATLTPGRWDSAFLAFLLGTGCRFGEALALRWEDVDREAGTASIQRSIAWIRGEWVETTPKTRAGVRSIALPPFVIRHLADWRAAQLETRLAAGSGWVDTGRVLTLEDGRTPSHHQAIDRFEARCGEAGTPRVRIHDLRHLHASLLLAEGLPIPAVSARLGHASPAVTMTVYAHALRGQDDAAAKAVQSALKRGIG